MVARLSDTRLVGGPGMAQTVAEVLVEQMIEAGIRKVYGIVGDSLNPVTDALRRKPLKWVDVRHEETLQLGRG